MAYTPINWQTGDTITAEKLNRCDNGWGVSSTQLFSETVTTATDPEYPDDPAVGVLAYSGQLVSDELAVSFDGVSYSCPKVDTGDPNINAYGGWGADGPDFVSAPFVVSYDLGFGDTVLLTPTGGTHAVSASAESIETSSAFQSAVASFIDTSTLPMRCVSGTTTAQAAYQAMSSGRMLFFNPYDDQYQMCFVTGLAQDGTVSFVPTLSGVTASVQGGLFVVSYS